MIIEYLRKCSTQAVHLIFAFGALVLFSGVTNAIIDNAADAAIFPRGGIAVTSNANPDPTIPAPGQWLELTATNAQTTFVSRVAGNCDKWEGGNPDACKNNTPGSATLTASISGTTLTTTANSGTINNGDVISDPATTGGAPVNIVRGTFVVSGGPCAVASCTLVLNQTQGTVTSETMHVNPPGLQANAITSRINCGSIDLFPYSGPSIDPDTGDVFYSQPGGHASGCNAVGVMRFSIAAAKATAGKGDWDQVLPPARHLPEYYPVPGWQQNWTPIIQALDFYYGTNVNGEYVIPASHTYTGVNVTPQGYLATGGFFPLAVSGGGAPGAGYFVDLNYGYVPLGPVNVPDNTDIGYVYPGLLYGYTLAQGGVNPNISAAYGPDGKLYSVGFANGSNYRANQLSESFPGYKNAPSSSTWRTASILYPACFGNLTAALVFPDPIAGAPHLMMMARTEDDSGTYCFAPTGVDHLQTASAVDTTTGGVQVITLTGTTPLTNDCPGSGIGVSGNNCGVCSGFCTWEDTYDPDTGKIYESDGSHTIGVITPNATTTWPVGLLTNSTAGSPPPDPSGNGCNGGTSTAAQYFKINGAKFLEIVNCARIFRYGILDNGCEASADGVLIVAGIGRACTLTDAGGHVWSFGDVYFAYSIIPRPNYSILRDGVAWNFPDGPAIGFAMQRSGGNIYIHQQLDAVAMWQDINSVQVASPGASPVTQATIGMTNYANLQSAAAAVTAGQTINIPAGTWMKYAANLGHGGAVNGVTIACAAGAALYAAGDPNNGAIINLFNASNTTISGCELGFGHASANNGPRPGLNIPKGSTNVTVNGGYYHDIDMCVLAGGNNGTLTFTNTVFEHCGGDTGSGAAAHNIYISDEPTGDTTTVAFSGGGSYCMRNVSLQNNIASDVGFEFKSRASGGTIQNFTIAEPSQHLYSDCNQSTAVDLPCGGNYIFGGASNGQGVVIELGPHYQAGPRGLIRFGAEAATVMNCPVSGTGYATNQILIQGSDASHPCWLINDTGEDIRANGINVPVVYQYTHSWSITVKNCKIINPYATSLANALGVGVTDGGGNTLYHSRADAGIAAYPFIPAPMSITLFFPAIARRRKPANDNALQNAA